MRYRHMSDKSKKQSFPIFSSQLKISISLFAFSISLHNLWDALDEKAVQHVKSYLRSARVNKKLLRQWNYLNPFTFHV
jgi:hypothetical protein